VLLNPAAATYSMLGAAHKGFLERFARAAGERGQKRVLVVQGLDGCDELPLRAVAAVEYVDGELNEMRLDPADYGLAHRQHHPCESPRATAQILGQTLRGESREHFDGLVYNAGVRLYLADRVRRIGEGIEQARAIVESGDAARKLEMLQR
jgi:anthranilate phosphoribosyltransferase